MLGHVKLEAWMVDNRYSQRLTAKMIGISDSTLSNILSVRQRPNAFMVEWCRTHCDIDPRAWLFPDEIRRLDRLGVPERWDK